MKIAGKIILFVTGLCLTTGGVLAQTFGTVAIGGGGYVPGIISCPNQQNLFYARTDVGGAYRWEEPTKSWISITDWVPPSKLAYLGVESLAADPQSPNRVYLVVNTPYFPGGTAILRSSDYGTNFAATDVSALFTANGNGANRNRGEELAVDPNLGSILFCGSRQKGLFKSTDYGATWSAVSSFNTNITIGTDDISFVKFDSQSGAPGTATPKIFVAVYRSGINLYVSNNGGVSWTGLTSSPAASLPQRCALAGNRLLYIAYGNDANGCIMNYNVTNGVWANCTPGGIAQTYGGISICATNPNLMVASTYNVWSYQPSGGGYGDKIFTSVNGGASWTDLFPNNKISLDYMGYGWITGGAIHWAGSIEMDPFNPNRVFVGSGNGIFCTENLNSGATTSNWRFMVKGLEETVLVTMLSVPNGPLLSSFLDVNGFVHTNINAPPPSRLSSKASGFAYASLTNFMVMAANGGGLSYSASLPITGWTGFATTPINMAGGTVAVSADGSTVLWNAANTAYVTTDRGATWTQSSGLNFNAAPVGDWQNPNKFYAFNNSDGYVYMSPNGGLAFAKAGLAGGASRTRFCVAPGFEGHVWIARQGSGLYFSTNSGASFQSANVYDAESASFGKAALGASYPTLYIWGQPTSLSTIGMYRSTDRASTWVRVNDNAHQYGGLGNAWMIEADKNVYGRVYMSTAGRGIPYMDVSQPSNYYNQAVLTYHPLALYEFNEMNDPSSGGQPAYDCAGGFNGTYGTTAKNGFNGILGPVPPVYTGFLTNNSALKTTYGDANSIVTLPNLNLNTNTVTIVAWIKPNTLANDRGIVYCRGNGTTAGLCIGNHGDSALAYNWNNNGNAYNWDSGLSPNLNEWAMVALVISSSNAVIYLTNPSKGMLSATNAVANVNQSFANPTTIGTDAFNSSVRAWDGSIDEVAIFNSSLSAGQIQNVYNAGLGAFSYPPSITQQPASQTVYAGKTASLCFGATGTALQYQWMSGVVGSGIYTTLPLGDRFSLGTNGALVISNVLNADQMDYVVVISNTMGAVVSSPATITVRPPGPLQQATIYSVNGLGGSGSGTAISVPPGLSPGGSTALTDIFSNARFSFETGPVGTTGEGILNSATGQTTGLLGGTLGAVSNLSAFTITLWVNLQNTATLNNYRWLEISPGAPPTGSTADGTLLFLGLNSFGGAQFYVNNVNANSGADIATANTWNGSGLQQNHWYFLAITYNMPAAQSYLYSGDANTASTMQYTFANTAGGSLNLSSATSIMLFNRPGNDRSWPGGIGNVNIYSGALTASQIESVRYTQVSPTNAAPYVAAPIVTPGTTIIGGTAVTLTGVAGGYQLSYQWQADGGGGGSLTNIPNATNPTLSVIPPSQPAPYNIRYQLLVSNDCGGGAITSPVTTLTVNPPPVIKPTTVLFYSVSIVRGTNIQLIGSNYPVTANAPFNVIWTSNLALITSAWLTNANLTGDRAFNGMNGRFTNVIVNATTSSQTFFRIQVP